MCGFLCILLCFAPQDQLSADMYSFVAKEIDYANYFQAQVSIQKVRTTRSVSRNVTVGMEGAWSLESRICQHALRTRWGFDYPTCE